MRFGHIAYPQKPLIMAHSGVSGGGGARCLKMFGVFFNLHTLFMREAKALGRSCIHAGSSFFHNGLKLLQVITGIQV